MLFGALDLVILATYIVVVLGLVFYFSGSTKNVTQYFLADRSVPWYIIGAALFSTDVSSMAVIGLASAGHASGLAVSNFVLSACVVLILLGWVFAPFYHKTGIMTMPEFLEKRFNKYCRLFLSIISILAYVLTKVSVILLAGGIILMLVMGWDLYTSCLTIVLVTGLYTLIGGSKGIIRAQLIQFIFLIIGSSILLYVSWNAIGGLEGIQSKVPTDYFSIFKPYTDAEFPWPGMVFGALILGIWYWTTDQYIVQITLSAKDVNHARTGTIWAAWLRILPMILLVLPGIIAKGLYPDIPSSEAYVTLVKTLLSPGLRAIVVISLLSALMSSLSSCFNATATLFTLDIYSKLYPKSNDFILVNIGRIATFVLVIMGIIWVPFINAISNDIYNYVQNVQAYIAPPICVVFLMGILWSRANDKAAFIVLITGFILGMLKFIADILCHTFYWKNSFISTLANIHSLHFAIFVFLLSCVLMIVISYAGKAPTEEKIKGYTLKYANESAVSETKSKWWMFNILGTVGMIALLITYWIIFG